MKTIGITGGIGSGKSVVSALLELYGIPVYIADEESKRLTQSSPVIRKGLIELFDESIYTVDGLDKRRLASLIFGNPQMLKAVNSLIHPEVYKDYLQWAESKHTELCALESAILFESGFNKLADYTVMVYAPEEIRDRLDQLGRLLIVTRQMDMLMTSEASIKSMADNFMAGDYH